MPRYFFDFSDDGRVVRDEEGTELPDLDAARDEALKTLAGIARDELPDGNRREFALTIRDGGDAKLTAKLLVQVEYAP
jgi:hypothetical protein